MHLPYHQIAMICVDVMVITVMLSAGTNGRGFDRRFQLTENKITQNTVTCEWLKRTITLALVTLNLIETQTDQGTLNEP